MTGAYWISAYGRDYNPKDWFYNPNYLINRIYYVVSGTAYYKKDTRLKPGYLYVFGIDADFRVSQDPEDPIDHVFFDFISYETYLNSQFTEVDLSGHEKLRHLILALTEEFSDPACPMQIASAYFEIIRQELERILGSGTHYSPVTKNILQIIHNGDLPTLTVREIARQANLNENYLIRVFHAEMGVTPHQYLNYMKAELAVAYCQQNLKMEEIAYRLGYSSVSSLSYSFKSITGKNLSSFRGKRD